MGENKYTDHAVKKFVTVWLWWLPLSGLFAFCFFPFLVLFPVYFVLFVFFGLAAFEDGVRCRDSAVSLAKWFGCFGVHDVYIHDDLHHFGRFGLASIFWLGFWYSLPFARFIGLLCGIGLVILIICGIVDSVRLNNMTDEEFIEYRKKL